MFFLSFIRIFFLCFFFFFNDTATTEIYTLSLHDALPISPHTAERAALDPRGFRAAGAQPLVFDRRRSRPTVRQDHECLDRQSRSETAHPGRVGKANITPASDMRDDVEADRLWR